MKLIYRGETYDYTPGLSRSGNTGRPARRTNPSQTPYNLIYRGSIIEVDPSLSQEETPLPTHYNLIYRGATYHVDRSQAVATIALKASAPKANAPKAVSVPATMPRRYVDKVHQANLLENLQRRLDTAKRSGDQHLINLLESERQQITAQTA